MNLAGDVLATASRLGGKCALRLDDAELAFGALDAVSARVAGLLRERGVAAGDRVGVLLPAVPELAAVAYGTLRAGAAAVLLDEGLGLAAIGTGLRASGAKLLLAWHARAEAAEAGARAGEAECLFVVPSEFRRLLAGVAPEAAVADRPAEAAAVILGLPGAGRCYSHGELRWVADRAVDVLALSEDDVVLAAASAARVPSLAAVVHAALARGACVTLLPRFDPARALAVLVRDGVTVLPATAAELRALVDERPAPPPATLRVCVTDGHAVPTGLAGDVQERLAPRLVAVPGAAARAVEARRADARAPGPPAR